jgi:hypothetical protein
MITSSPFFQFTGVATLCGSNCINLEVCISAVTPEEFRTAYPKLRIWIEKTLAFYEKNAQPVISMHFMRLPLYFGHRLLEIVKFVAIDRVPMPPLTAMGLSRFAAFEQGNFDGITYEDRYFIERSVATEESLHFHELIHVIQWRLTRTGRLSCSLWKTPTSKPAAVSHHCGGFRCGCIVQEDAF